MTIEQIKALMAKPTGSKMTAAEQNATNIISNIQNYSDNIAAWQKQLRDLQVANMTPESILGTPAAES
jgi:hypothetical protein